MSTNKLTPVEQGKTFGLPGVILRGLYHSPGGGISATYDRVVVIGDGVPGIDPVRDDVPAVVIRETVPGHKVLVPVSGSPGGDGKWYMFSGAYVAPGGFTGDWKTVFGHGLPMPLHDRTES